MNVSSLSGALCASVFVFVSTTVNAALIELGGGLVYDQDQDLTWTQDASMSGSLSWDAAMSWAENLVFGGVSGWRLPTTTQFDDTSCSGDVRGVFGLFYEHRLGCVGGEMERLTAAEDPWTNELFKDDEGKTTVNRTRYWTATPYRDGTDPCVNYPDYDVPCTLPTSEGEHVDFRWQWAFTGAGDIEEPYKTTLSKGNSRYAWAVHEGRVSAVPIPAAIYLFGSGLLGLLGLMKRAAG